MGQKDDRSRQESLRESFQKQGKLPADNAKGITEKLLNFIILDQPLSVVENAEFHSLIEHLQARYSLPSRKYLLETALPELYNNQVSWDVKRSSSPELYYRYLDFSCLPAVILACRELISASYKMNNNDNIKYK